MKISSMILNELKHESFSYPDHFSFFLLFQNKGLFPKVISKFGHPFHKFISVGNLNVEYNWLFGINI
jgi:hypothetical protein